MKKLDPKVILFNAAAVLITVVAVAGVLRSLVFSPTAVPCSDRYTSSTTLALERVGVVLTAADLQSSLGGRDAGVIEDVAIVRLKDGPAPVAMAVSLPKGSASPVGSPKGGMSFPWEPRVIQGKTAACLSYNVLLPADFQFNRGGVLPGISGADTAGPSQEGFTARMVWRPGDVGGATLRTTSGGEARNASAEYESFAFPRGRWVKLEQEVVLNAPKQADGVLRVWVDGRLAVDRTDLIYRMKPGVTLSGVAADLFYGTEDGTGAAPRDAKVSLTPFVIRW